MKKYRIKEETLVCGHKRWYVQSKGLFFWRDVKGAWTDGHGSLFNAQKEVNERIALDKWVEGQKVSKTKFINA